MRPLAGLWPWPDRPYRKPGSAQKWSCYLGDSSLRGGESSNSLVISEIGIGGERDKNLCEFISRIREALGVANHLSQVQLVKKVFITQHEESVITVKYKQLSKRLLGEENTSQFLKGTSEQGLPLRDLQRRS